jgi:tRNA pseudouridine-54 N-methylase
VTTFSRLSFLPVSPQLESVARESGCPRVAEKGAARESGRGGSNQLFVCGALERMTRGSFSLISGAKRKKLSMHPLSYPEAAPAANSLVRHP